MLLAILTLIACAAAANAAWRWWPSPVNPVLVGAVMWTPALVMLNFPPNFLSAIYIHLNMPMSGLVILALVVSFVSFWLGCMIVRTLAPSGDFTIHEDRVLMNFSPYKALALFLVGLLVFAYSFAQSGLLSIGELDATQVAESRAALYIGWVNFLVLLTDICSFALLAYAIKTRRLRWAIPFVIALLAYSATLQKTAVMWFAVGGFTASAVQPRAAIELFWRPLPMRIALMVISVVLVASLFLINDLRGISDFQLTAASSPWIEQLYIYSGASAIMNLSVSIDQYLQSTPPSYGLMLMRPLFWLVMDPDRLLVARYFEGVNTGTYLIYGWSDFRWLGFFVTPLAAGVLSMIYLRLALRGSLVGLILGAIVMRAMVFSASTDILFDPTSTITIVMAAFASFICQRQYRVGTPRRAIYPSIGPATGAGNPQIRT